MVISCSKILQDFDNSNLSYDPEEAYAFVKGLADHVRNLIDKNPNLTSGQIADLIIFPN
jgi:hypothetical protein